MATLGAPDGFDQFLKQQFLQFFTQLFIQLFR